MDKRVTIDLRSGLDFTKSHLSKRYKWFIYGYYGLLALILGLIAFMGVHLGLSQKTASSIESDINELSASIQEVNAAEQSLKKQLIQVNTLVHWQKSHLHMQHLLHRLFVGLPKEVLLERFTYRMNGQETQVSITMELKGSSLVLNEEFEKVPERLMDSGLKLISFDQVEVKGGLQLKCLCQVDDKTGGRA